MFAIEYYHDGSSSEKIYPKNGVSFGKYELARNDRKIVNILIYQE